MKKKKAVIYLLVDYSVSMRKRQTATQEGLEAFILKQKKDVPDAELRIIAFGTTYNDISRSKAKEVGEINYTPDEGSTMLFGSVGRAISELIAEKADYKTLVFLTDGENNASQHTKWRTAADVANDVRIAREAGITIMMLSTGLDAFGISKSFGLDSELTSDFVGTGEGAKRALEVYGDAVVRSSTGKRASLTTLERAAIEESPEDIAARNGEELVTLKKAAKLLQEMYNKDKTQFFSVSFKKRTPPYKNRTYAKAQFHVVSAMKGGEAAYDFEEKKLVPCFVQDLVTAEESLESKGKKKEGSVTGFRSIPLDGIIALRAGGKAYRVKTGG